ncbi:MAG: hypothetical protein HKN41_03680 [Ilumatobacter sp.]|nr:hypothetical protein [Ilumatobacter sp.]
MTIERRLYHAARELRAVPIEVPELGEATPARRMRKVPALAAPVLFVVGGLVAVSGVFGVGAQGHHDFVERDFVEPVAVDAGLLASSGPIAGQLTVPSSDRTDPSTPGAPPIRVELEMIAALMHQRSAATAPLETGAVSEALIGPI